MSTLLEVKDLTVRYGSSDFLAADSVSFQVSPGEVLGIVGESGSGKTTVGLAVLGLLPASAKVSGSVLFEGNDLIGLKVLANEEIEPVGEYVYDFSVQDDENFVCGTGGLACHSSRPEQGVNSPWMREATDRASGPSS